MQVRFFFFVKKVAGTDAVTVPASSAPDIRALLSLLAERLGPAFKNEVLTQDGHVRPNVNILVNGRNIGFLQGTGTVLKDEDTVTILSAVAGG